MYEFFQILLHDSTIVGIVDIKWFFLLNFQFLYFRLHKKIAANGNIFLNKNQTL